MKFKLKIPSNIFGQSSLLVFVFQIILITKNVAIMKLIQKLRIFSSNYTIYKKEIFFLKKRESGTMCQNLILKKRECIYNLISVLNLH